MMRKAIRNFVVLIFLMSTPLFVTNVFADAPPDPGGGPGTGDPPVGGGAPLGSGLIILLSLASGYGARKIYKSKKNFI